MSPTAPLAPRTRHTIGQRRRRLGIPGYQLASLAGVSPVLLGKIERGMRPASPNELRRVEHALDVLEQTWRELRAEAEAWA